MVISLFFTILKILFVVLLFEQIKKTSQTLDRIYAAGISNNPSFVPMDLDIEEAYFVNVKMRL